MASLELGAKTQWFEQIAQHKGKWIVFGLNSSTTPNSERMNGMAGLIDWFVHGQVSKMVSKNQLYGEFCLIPSENREKPNFLLYHYPGSPELKKAGEKIRSLHIQELTIAESTFPEDFCKKLKQNLEKDGIQLSKLE